MKKILLGLVVCAGFCACTNDDIVNVANSSADDSDAVYVKFGLSVGDVTRSTTDTQAGSDYGTSTDGEEYGQDYENYVGSVSVVLVSSGNTIASTTVNNPEKVGTDTYVVAFEKKEIKSYAGETVNVYVYCNQSVETFSEDATYVYPGITPWTENAFYMTNAVEHSAVLPSADEMSAHNTIANPIDLGVVRVERSMARFDYKDGAPNAAEAPYTYPIWYDSEGQQGLLASLELKSVALINMSNSFYAFRHMAANVEDENPTADLTNLTILSTEYANNWVVDTDASNKLGYNSGSSIVSFSYPLSTPSTWSWTDVSDITEDDDNSTWNDGGDKGVYHIWRYAIENTIPSVDDQLKGITTGIVFKTQLVSNTEGFVLGGGTGGRVYVYENNLYACWDDVVTAAEAAGEGSTLHDAYLEVMDAVSGAFDEYDSAVTAAMAEAGFTGYSPDSDGNYYVYYYYWNRHNDNGIDGTMGIMEFAVVRNNVYKLSVTDITGFGHPSPTDPDDPNQPSPDPDPDPENPDDPDETEDIYLKLDVEILPWVVRVNDITF